MRFIVDECTGPSVARWLRERGDDVCSVYDDHSGADDSFILAKAVGETRILVINDKDFGEMIFRERRTHCGVILRLDDERPHVKIDALRLLLARDASAIPNRFVVVTEKRVRFA